MTDKKKYLYGPVPSRRLGRSYGVDIVPLKDCTLDCVYCQLGKSLKKTVERKDYGPVEPILAELKAALAEGTKADFITIAGSGEPTLNLRLGELIDGIRKLTDIKIAILTNGTLLDRSDVRADCAKADVVMPSLDAGDEETFRKINRPHSSISFENLVSGLCKFRKEYSGRIWLEVFLAGSINTGTRDIARIAEAIERIGPDKIQLNTAVRPTAEANVARLDPEQLTKIAGMLGPKCEVIADFSHIKTRGPDEEKSKDLPEHHFATDRQKQALLSTLKRRPCCIEDISAGLGMDPDEISRHVTDLLSEGLIISEERDGKVFYKTLS